MLRLLVKRLPDLSRSRKRTILVCYDLAAMIVSLWAAFSTRLGFIYVPTGRRVLLSAGVFFIVGLAALYRLRIYHIVLRFADRHPHPLRRGNRGDRMGDPRLCSQCAHHGRTCHPSRPAISGLHLLRLDAVHGPLLHGLAARGGRSRQLLARPRCTKNGHLWSERDRDQPWQLGSRIVGLPADRFRRRRPCTEGQVVAGVPIYAPEALERLAQSRNVDEVFLAMPNATRSERLAAISQVRELGLQVKTVPAPEEIVSGRFTVSDIRPVDVGDLLRRDPVEPIGELIREAVEGRPIQGGSRELGIASSLPTDSSSAGAASADRTPDAFCVLSNIEALSSTVSNRS
jgi:hypothetical protein